jgi:hypothetical protein
MPVFAGKCCSKRVNASNPPAEAPMPTIGKNGLETLAKGMSLAAVSTLTDFFLLVCSCSAGGAIRGGKGLEEFGWAFRVVFFLTGFVRAFGFFFIAGVVGMQAVSSSGVGRALVVRNVGLLFILNVELGKSVSFADFNK